MHPELLHLGPVVLPTYGAALGLAFLLGVLLLKRRAPAYGIDGETAVDMGIWLILSGLLGAKLLLLVVEGPGYYLTSFRGLFELFRAGGVFYGGLLGALVAAVFFVKVKKVPFLDFADAAAPGVALGQAIGRLGCLAAGCCWGGQCTKPWAITFTDPHAGENVGVPMGVPLHPTQLYEAVGLFVLFGLILAFGKGRAAGRTFSVYLIGAAILRFTVEFYRDDPRGLVPGTDLSTSQGIAVGLFVLGVAILALGWKKAGAPAEA
jgi:phosphatidylglycerol---prolipoprotein diacylglyceryl transferase